MTPLLWALLLLAAAIAFIFLELFLPSGGVLTVLSLGSAASAVVLVYYFDGLLPGTLFLAAVAVMMPAAVAAAIHWWPYTALGRKVLNLPPGSDGEFAERPAHAALKSLIGQQGLAISKMLPAGSISLAGRSYDAVCQTGAVEPGEPVRVVDVNGTRIIVHKVETPPQARPPAETPHEPPALVDPFEEPLI